MVMLRKNKQLIIGMLIGALVFGGIPVFAATGQYILTQAQYKIVVSGVEYTDTEYPILNYNGTTYVPLRAVGKLLGNEPRWNEEKRQVELGETIDIDLSQWIGITDAAKIHSIKIYLGKELILEKGGKKYTVPAPKTNKSEIQTLKDASSDVTFSVIIYQNRTYIKINDLKAAGLI